MSYHAMQSDLNRSQFNLWTLALNAVGLVSLESVLWAREQVESSGMFKLWSKSRRLI